MQQQVQVQMSILTKVFQGDGTKPGCISVYMETVCCAMIKDMDAAPKTQAKQFHQPAKNPHTRPYLPAVMEAQWYTPLAEGMPDASSASEAATSQ